MAANSIVGFVLGLGDRHPYNILLDETTAEMIHIDLGLAFDQVVAFQNSVFDSQAKLLKIPETVPFRLTQDIVDGSVNVKTMCLMGQIRCIRCGRCLPQLLRAHNDGPEVQFGFLLYVLMVMLILDIAADNFGSVFV